MILHIIRLQIPKVTPIENDLDFDFYIFNIAHLLNYISKGDLNKTEM